MCIDYRQSLAGMAAAGEYDFVDPEISFRSIRVKRGRTLVEAVLVGFNHSVAHTDALKRMELQGLRPGSIAEGLAFESQHRDILRNSAIVMLGSSCEDLQGYVYVSYLMGGGDYRYFRKRKASNPWDLGQHSLRTTTYSFLAFLQ